ncbi:MULTISPECIES: EAL domain-containing protein [unclassified Enterobacter]|uniref:sensor domain-containing phosphodiesterase n=1 Tax=unclassified Enterobacter TaxID=2608935 RepID=UPI0010F63E85|nr:MULTISPECIES: EAL domain-containing protein [unclassified Enterobacter]MDI3425003.1 EAL domain-containing protein [Enterobacter sp. V87_3]
MKRKTDNNVKIAMLALALCLITVPFSRYISPRAVVNGYEVYLAWLPLSVMLAAVLLFGRRAVIPVLISIIVTNIYNLHLNALQHVILLFCQTFPVFAACGLLRLAIGRRWRHSVPNKYIGMRIFWLGFMVPVGIKLLMYLAGYLFDFPVAVSTFFGEGSAIYNIIDIQSLICAALIFTMMFYYPLRMIMNPGYARVFWRRSVKPFLFSKKPLFIIVWLTLLVLFIAILCAPFESPIIAGYLMPIVFILFTLGIRRLSYALISLLWAVSALMLLTYNYNFLNGVETGYSLSFILSVLISFAICLLYMSKIYRRSEWMKQGWQERALTDPLTGLPNIRALEDYLQDHPDAKVCCLRMDNLEFLSRHYGILMRVHCKRSVTATLQPYLQHEEKLFQLPGSELVVVLLGPEPSERLQYMVDHLNSRKIIWNKTALEIEFGAAWGEVEGGEHLHPMLGQLSWLAEQSCATHRVLGLTNSLETVSGQTTDRVLMLGRIKRALEEGGLRLYAQPIQNAQGKGYYEILTRIESEGEIITPDRFIPLVAQFNLSHRFDMSVVESLLEWLKNHPEPHAETRFSVNLMPLTLMQKEAASEIIQLFERYFVSPNAVVIEITEEQAFSNSGASIKNIQTLREYGFRIAIDDFGTGYANYERLKRLQADIIKIDGCFVKDICSDSMDAMIVQSICNLAKTKSLCVVAEYVETPEQREMLLRFGVDYLQGYLIGKPAPLSELQA